MTQYIMYNLNYLGPKASSIIQQAEGSDLSTQFNMNEDALAMIPCMDVLHRAGVLDTRLDLKCRVSNGILLAFTCTLVAIMMIKFLASLQFGRLRQVRHLPGPLLHGGRRVAQAHPQLARAAQVRRQAQAALHRRRRRHHRLGQRSAHPENRPQHSRRRYFFFCCPIQCCKCR